MIIIIIITNNNNNNNNIIWRAIKCAQIPVAKVPVGLTRSDGKLPDGATRIPWSRGKPLAWDVTIPDTFISKKRLFSLALLQAVS